MEKICKIFHLKSLLIPLRKAEKHLHFYCVLSETISTQILIKDFNNFSNLQLIIGWSVKDIACIKKYAWETHFSSFPPFSETR